MRPRDPRRSHRRPSIGATTCLAVVALVALAAACTSLLAIKDPTLEDAGGGGGTDAAPDAAVDSAIDATPIDSAIDGPPAVCTTGACCSPVGQFEPATKLCGTATEFRCSGASTCGAQPQQRTVQTFCSGSSAACDGMVVNGNFTNTGTACTVDQICQLQSGAAPQCAACGFGCDSAANACRPAKVFVALSMGGFQGGAVGGRAGADLKCATDFNTRFASLACNSNHAHAIMTVAAADTLGGMATKFGIPTTVPVNRADDNAIVTNNWNDFVNPNLQLTNPASLDTVLLANRQVWTGANGADICGGWASTSANGVRGDTSQLSALRFNNEIIGCTLSGHLLCVCWSGP